MNKKQTLLLTTALTLGLALPCNAGQQEFYDELYNNLVARNTEFSITYQGNYQDVFDIGKMVDTVCAMHKEGSTDDFDYLLGNLKHEYVNLPSIGEDSTRFDFTIQYSESKQWLDQVNASVAQVLPELNQGNYIQRIKNIHDYVVNHITYDQSLSKYTAYEGIVGQSTVCQGYALLMYKMLNEAGIPTRYVNGMAGTRHAWNLVKVGEKWYFIDATWDDPLGSRPILRYDYFLIGLNKLSKDHTLDAKFLTDDFLAQYPISNEDYDFNQPAPEIAVAQATPSTQDSEQTTQTPVATETGPAVPTPTEAMTKEPEEEGSSADYNFNVRQELRRIIVEAYEQDEDLKKAKETNDKILVDAIDLEKQILLTSFMLLSDAQLASFLESDTKIDKALDYAADKVNTTFLDPVDAYAESPEFAKQLDAAWEQEVKKFDPRMSEEALNRYAEKFGEEKSNELMQIKLNQLSAKYTEATIKDIHQYLASLQ